MANEDKILQKLTEHDKRFDQQDKKFDLIVGKLSEHDRRFDELVTKVEFTEFKNQVHGTQDQMLTIIRRLDEERLFTAAWVDRIEKEIEKIKQHLKIS